MKKDSIEKGQQQYQGWLVWYLAGNLYWHYLSFKSHFHLSMCGVCVERRTRYACHYWGPAITQARRWIRHPFELLLIVIQMDDIRICMNRNTSYLQACFYVIRICIHTCTRTNGIVALDSHYVEKKVLTWMFIPAELLHNPLCGNKSIDLNVHTCWAIT